MVRRSPAGANSTAQSAVPTAGWVALLAAATLALAGCGGSSHPSATASSTPGATASGSSGQLLTGAARTALAAKFTKIFDVELLAGVKAGQQLTGKTPDGAQYSAILAPYGASIVTADTQMLALHAPGKDGTDIAILAKDGTKVDADFKAAAHQTNSQIAAGEAVDDSAYAAALRVVDADLGIPPIPAASPSASPSS